MGGEVGKQGEWGNQMDQSGLFTIPSGRNFLESLAAGLLSYADQYHIDLPIIRVMLPTRRAVRGLRDAFITQKKNVPTLLPRIHPLGDVDAEELDFTLSGLGLTELDQLDIPPAISTLERQFILAQLIRAKDSSIKHAQSLSLAKDLATLLDQSHTEGLALSGLKSLVPQEDFADHWQNILKFLEIISDAWPKILEARGQIDPALRRAYLMNHLSTIWRDHPPKTPIIAAGSTGSVPTTAQLMKIVSQLPRGMVILPGLDLEMDEFSWKNLDDTHPQRTMKNLLDSFEIERSAVKIWPTPSTEHQQKHSDQAIRRALIREMMRPAESFGSQKLTPAIEANLNQNITICEAMNAREESQTIATMIRFELQTPHQTICLVTPDRQLAARVTTALKRWGIEADDSAGVSLSQTCSGQFFLHIVTLIAENFSPLALLQLIKHPLSIFKDLDFSNFEKHVLRGPAPTKGWQGIISRINALNSTLNDPIFLNILKIKEPLETGFAPLIDLSVNLHNPLELFQKILKQCEIMAGGEDVFWAAEESDSLSHFFSKFLQECQNLADMNVAMSIAEFADMVRVLMDQETHRTIQPRNPRIVILGQMESRLIQHDVMILSSLNEGTWPAEPAHDPWMSRMMRKKYGLSSPTRTIGLAAHDFTEAMAAPRVYLTRSIKSEGTETVPSRWLQRLSTLIKSSNFAQNWSDNEILSWTRQLDKSYSPYFKPLPPSPCPPVALRPRQLSATSIEKWIKNPYHIYAQKILKLKRIKSIDEDEIFSDRGTFLHEVLEEFITATRDHLPPKIEAVELFKSLAQQRLQKLEQVSPHWHYWWPKIDLIADWVVEQEQEWRTHARPYKLEESGAYQFAISDDFAGDKNRFTLTAKADRIDRLKTGGFAILDYKSGSIPTQKKIKCGQAPQLALEALILQKGGYKVSGSAEVKDLIYWKVAAEGETRSLSDKFGEENLQCLINEAEDGLKNLVRFFDDPSTPYTPLPLLGRIYEDERGYAHLARMGEWAVMGGENSEENEDDISSAAASAQNNESGENA